MRRTRTVKRIIENSDSEDDIPLKKLYPSPSKDSYITNKRKENDYSSSESDIENYLQPVDKIDLNSSFFNTRREYEDEFNKIEKELFAGITRLSDSDSDIDTNEETVVSQNFKEDSKQIEMESKPSTSSTKLNFQQLEEYARQIEEAKKHIEKYNAKKKSSIRKEENNSEISNLLAVGESRQMTLENIKPEDLHSSDFESCDSEQDWEEVKHKDSEEVKETNAIPKQDLQIVVDMPDSCRKKKGVDLLAAMKRRLNRIRKENQILVHKVHLLCWLAHGNYVNEAINNTQTLGLALSLLPSDKCYPSDRTDLNYLEQIVQWYKKAMKLIEKSIVKKKDLVDILKLQISKKEAYERKMFVYIFIAILRSLGIQCRLILSFQIEPLRPPASELHSITKDSPKNEKKDTKSKNQHSKSKIKKIVEETKITKEIRIKSSAKTIHTDDKNGVKNEDKSKTCKVDTSGNLKKNSTDTHNQTGEHRSKKQDNKNKEKRQKPNTIDVEETKKGHSKSKVNGAENKSNKAGNIVQKLRSQNTKNAEKSVGHCSNNLEVKEHKRGHSKSVDNSKEKVSLSKIDNASKSEIIKVKFTKKNKVKSVAQLDGTNNSSDEDTSNALFIPQLDGANDKKKKSSPKKPNLKKLSAAVENSCKVKKHPNLMKSRDNECNSEDDFRSRSPFTNKNTESPKLLQNHKINLHKLKSTNKTNNHPENIVTSPKKQLDVKNDIVNLIKGRITEQKHLDRSRKVKKRKSYNLTYTDNDSDSDFMPEPIKKKHHDRHDIDYFVPKPKVKKRIAVPVKESDKKILSSDSDSEKAGKKKGNNVWVEVFLEAEEKWISVDVVQGQVHCINELFTRATHPVSYIVAWDNNNKIKDVTKRYCTNFNTITRKLRIDAKWWHETLKPFLGKYTARDKEEDDDLNRQQLDQPLPKSITEYKNHPLYALRRHLLKFEEIYPPDIQPLGFIRGEAVYPRNCVYVCRSRDIWLKEAKVVKAGEKPYKIVKARPKYDKLSNKIITDQLLEIFGEWQTMDYEPPTAENGIVPRNAFGNVELFKVCMLPKGTVHLKLPGLNKVCRRMNIDCASAIVGFDFHGGWSHPMYDGFVVCEEFADSVVAAWELEQDEIEKRENEKIEKRVYGNWKKLIKGLLIRERLKAKYDFGDAGTSGEGKEKKPKGPRFCTKKR